MDSNSNLISAIDAVCEAMKEHAVACEAGEPVPTIIAKAEAATQAVLQYEQLLWRNVGWSNPFRHLGPLPFFRSAEELAPPAGSERFEVKAEYRLRVSDISELTALVSGRFGEEVSDGASALQVLAQAEGWDPSALPVRGLQVEAASAVVNHLPS